MSDTTLWFLYVIYFTILIKGIFNMTQIRYKLTDQNLQTYNNFQWILGEEQSSPGTGELCSSGWLHCYTNPLLAIFLNPIHANFHEPRLFRVEVHGECKIDLGLKEGWSRMKLVEELEFPQPTLTQRIAFGILCAKQVCQDEFWQTWADKWLSGEDRSYESADKTYRQLYSSAATTGAATTGAAAAANAAAITVGVAPRAVAAAGAARAAARRRASTAAGASDIDLISLAKEAMEKY